MIGYGSLAGIIEEAKRQGCGIWSLTLAQQAQDAERPEQELFEEMRRTFRVMEQAAREGIDPDLRSTSGLTGGSAYLMQEHLKKGTSLCGETLGQALVYALAVSELNAAMGRIVAAPTAGSCGILPATLLSARVRLGADEDVCVRALFTSSAVGMVIANNAYLAGAQGGCQAECGSAAAMAAAALVEMAGGSPEQAGEAAAIALKNILGLVCDPVAGLVEIPCIKRNAAGVAGAFVAAEMALAGIASAIPVDEVIVAMKRIGDAMSPALKETAEGGLAATPTGRRLHRQVFGSREEQPGT